MRPTPFPRLKFHANLIEIPRSTERMKADKFCLDLLHRDLRQFRYLSRAERHPHPFNTIEERNAYIVRLGHFVWRRASRKTREQLLDSFQNGFLGLIRAAQTYDRTRASFLHHAHFAIDGYIMRLYYDEVFLIRLPVHRQIALRRYWRLRDAQPHRKPLERLSCCEVASTLGRQLSELAEDELLQPSSFVRPDELYCVADEEDNVPLIVENGWSRLADQAILQPDQLLEAQEAITDITDQVRTTIERIPRRLAHLRAIFMYHYGFDGHGQPRTLEQSAEHFRLTRERVRQCIEQVWQQLPSTYATTANQARVANFFADIADLGELIGQEVDGRLAFEELWRQAQSAFEAWRCRFGASKLRLKREGRYLHARQLVLRHVPALPALPRIVFTHRYGMQNGRSLTVNEVMTMLGLTRSEYDQAIHTAWEHIRRQDPDNLIPRDGSVLSRILRHSTKA